MKIGLLVKISYKGSKFFAFDELADRKTVKGLFKEYILSKNIKIYKGIQQAARTDAKVNSKENYLYFITENINLDKIELNIDIQGLKILDIYIVKKDIVLPDMVEKREYIYYYSNINTIFNKEEIDKRCLLISGKKDFSKFTNHKGLKLKNHIRKVCVREEEGKLIFMGDSFLPEQVRRMTSYILKDKIKPANPKFLILNKVVLKEEIFKI